MAQEEIIKGKLLWGPDLDNTASQICFPFAWALSHIFSPKVKLSAGENIKLWNLSEQKKPWWREKKSSYV